MIYPEFLKLSGVKQALDRIECAKSDDHILSIDSCPENLPIFVCTSPETVKCKFFIRGICAQMKNCATRGFLGNLTATCNFLKSFDQL